MSIIYYCILTYYIDDLQYRTYMAAAPILGYLHIFIFILFTNSTVIQPETDVNYRDDIAFVESGRYQIARPIYRSKKQESRHHWYRVSFKYSHPKNSVKVALSITHIKQYNNANNLDFLIRPAINQTYFDAMLTISLQTAWVLLDFNYLASSRDQFYCGIFFANQESLIQLNGPKTSIRSYVPIQHIIRSNNLNKKYEGGYISAHAYISGIRIQQTQFNLSIKSCSYLRQVVYVELSVQNISKPVQMLCLSYVLYAQRGQLIFDQDLPMLGQQLFQDIIEGTNLGMVGITGINANKLEMLMELIPNTKQNPQGSLQVGKKGTQSQQMSKLAAIIERQTFRQAFMIEAIDIYGRTIPFVYIT